MDNLFEQMANISKAHGYDILAKQVEELKEENRNMAKALTEFIECDHTSGSDLFRVAANAKMVLKSRKPYNL